MLVEQDKIKLTFLSGKEIELTKEEFEELEKYFEKTVYIHSPNPYPISPYIPYPDPAPYPAKPWITWCHKITITDDTK